MYSFSSSSDLKFKPARGMLHKIIQSEPKTVAVNARKRQLSTYLLGDITLAEDTLQSLSSSAYEVNNQVVQKHGSTCFATNLDHLLRDNPEHVLELANETSRLSKRLKKAADHITEFGRSIGHKEYRRKLRYTGLPTLQDQAQPLLRNIQTLSTDASFIRHNLHMFVERKQLGGPRLLGLADTMANLGEALEPVAAHMLVVGQTAAERNAAAGVVPATSESFATLFPLEVLHCIMWKLPLKDAVALGSTCTRLRAVLKKWRVRHLALGFPTLSAATTVAKYIRQLARPAGASDRWESVRTMTVTFMRRGRKMDMKKIWRHFTETVPLLNSACGGRLVHLKLKLNAYEHASCSIGQLVCTPGPLVQVSVCPQIDSTEIVSLVRETIDASEATKVAVSTTQLSCNAELFLNAVKYKCPTVALPGKRHDIMCISVVRVDIQDRVLDYIKSGDELYDYAGNIARRLREVHGSREAAIVACNACDWPAVHSIKELAMSIPTPDLFARFIQSEKYIAWVLNGLSLLRLRPLTSEQPSVEFMQLAAKYVPEIWIRPFNGSLLHDQTIGDTVNWAQMYRLAARGGTLVLECDGTSLDDAVALVQALCLIVYCEGTTTFSASGFGYYAARGWAMMKRRTLPWNVRIVQVFGKSSVIDDELMLSKDTTLENAVLKVSHFQCVHLLDILFRMDDN